MGTPLGRDLVAGNNSPVDDPAVQKVCPSIGCEVLQRSLIPLQLIDCSSSTRDPHTVDIVEFYTSYYHGYHYRIVDKGADVPFGYMAFPKDPTAKVTVK